MDQTVIAAMNAIDIKNQKLSCSAKDLEKLESEEGCPLHLLKNKVYDDDDDDLREDEDENGSDESYADEKILNQEAREERMRREYLALALNANRDPVSSGHDNQFKEIIEEGEEVYTDALVDRISDHVHMRYKRLGNFDVLLTNKDSPFDEIAPGLVYKRRLRSGIGQQANINSIIIYNCAMWTEGKADPFDSSWLRHNVVVTDLSSDSILPGLQELLLTCRKGEWFEGLIRPKAAFGTLGVRPRIPPNATIFCVLEVVKVVELDKISRFVRCNPDDNHQTGPTFKELFEASDVARQRGNYFLSQREYKTALQRYKSGIRILEGITYKDEAEEKTANELLIKLYNNSAKAANYLGAPRLALAACKQASLIDDLEPKTHWLRMQAWRIKGHPERALGKARRAIQLFGNRADVIKPFQREAEELKRRIQAGECELRDLYQSMGRVFRPASD